MSSQEWLAYFTQNADRRAVDLPRRIDLDEPLRGALARSLRQFQLGETGEGNIAREATVVADPALDDALRQCIGLYIREEARHARELRAVLLALGIVPLERASAQSLFQIARRALGRGTIMALRQKMLTICAAEVVGIVFYQLVAERVPSAEIAATAGAIAEDERRHLDFQALYFRRVLETTPASWRPGLTALLAGGLTLVVGGAMVTVLIDQRPFFQLVGCSPWELARRCWTEIELRLPLQGTAPSAAVTRRTTRGGTPASHPVSF